MIQLSQEIVLKPNVWYRIDSRKVLFRLTWFMAIFTLITMLSISSWIYFFNLDLTLSYNDARSHLNIARRVVESLSPGFSQIGSVWLPLFHVLEIPTVWNDFMYRTGLSGSIISMAAFIGSGILIFKIARLFRLTILSQCVATFVFIFNLNMLFMQTTPMTESLMIFTSLLSIFFLLKWIKTDAILDLIFCGVATFLGIMTRYDGWFLFGFISLTVPIISFIRHGRKKAEAHLILYSIIGAFGILLWFGWNAVIFHDPLYFLNGPFSAKVQQDALFREGRLFTKGDVVYSAYTYLLTVKENIGFPLLILGSIGAIKVFVSRLDFLLKIGFTLLLVPVFFNVISLYFGHSVINLPELPPYSWFNDRYGLLSLPFVAVGLGFLVNKRFIAGILAIFIILSTAYTMYVNNKIITIQDGVRGSSGYFLDDVGRWVNKNAKDDKILVAASSNDALIFVSGLPLSQFITEGTGKYWSGALKEPQRYAGYVIMHEEDEVYKKLNTNPYFLSQYVLSFKGNFTNVYKRITPKQYSFGKALIEANLKQDENNAKSE